MPYNDLLKGRVSIPGMEYMVTTVCSGRRPFFSQRENAMALTNELQALENRRLVEWLAWVIMPDHFHGLLRLPDDVSLSYTMQLLKGRSARVIGGPLWEKGFHDHALRSDECRQAVSRYLIANPVRAGITASLRDYPFWYCCWVREGDDPDLFLQDR